MFFCLMICWLWLRVALMRWYHDMHDTRREWALQSRDNIDCRCCIHISFSLREPACKHFGQKSSEIKGIEATQKMLYMYFCTCTCNSLLWTICFNSGSQKRRLLPSKAATSLVPKREATSCSLCRKSCATTLEKDAKVERRHPGLHILSCHNIFCTSVGSPKLCGMQLQRPWIL